MPLQHQGSPEDVLSRIEACGSTAMLAFEGDSHVGQLQFRPYIEDTVSPNGLHHPLYWMDFQGRRPRLPERTLALFCYHVGQLDDTDARDPRYFGRGIGMKLLDEVIAWMASAGFVAVVAKGLSELRPVIEFMGGMPASAYTSRGFKIASTYQDEGLRTCLDDMLEGRLGEERKAALQAQVDEGADLEKAAEVGICIREFGQ